MNLQRIEMAEVRERDCHVSDIGAESASLLVRQLQKLFEQIQLVQHFER
jgi:hypothetical protein